MKYSSRTKLNKALSHMYPGYFKTNDIMVTGSIALDIMGLLPESREVHDVDLIIRMTDNDWKNLKLLEAIHGNGEKGYGDCLTFNADGLGINVWKTDKPFSTSIKDESGVWVSPVRDILSAKKKYGRVKDYKDINDICKSILG